MGETDSYSSVFNGDKVYSFKFQKEKKKKTRFSGKDLFRVSIRQVLYHYEWIKDDLLSPDELAKKDMERGHLLTFQEKVLLLQSPRNRPEAEVKKVAEKFVNCRYFRGFSMSAIINIFKVIRFEYISPNRTIIKQGHPPQNMYIVIGGEAITRVLEKPEKIYQEDTDKIIYFHPGCKFGDVDLYFGEPRDSSVWTEEKGAYLLCLNSKLFEFLWAPNGLDQLWLEIKKTMFIFRKYFRDFPKVGVREIFLKSTVEVTPANSCVKKCTKGQATVMFIIEGIVQVIQRLLVYEFTLKRHQDKHSYQIYNYQEILGPLPANVKPIFMNTVTLASGACVGIGEQLFKHTMVAVTETKTLRVPLTILYKHSFSYTWRKISQTLDTVCPDPAGLFEAFVDGRQWAQYKNKFIQYKQSSWSHLMTVHNVPMLMRAEHLRLKPGLIKRIDRDPDFQLYKELCVTELSELESDESSTGE